MHCLPVFWLQLFLFTQLGLYYSTICFLCIPFCDSMFILPNMDISLFFYSEMLLFYIPEWSDDKGFFSLFTADDCKSTSECIQVLLT